MSFEGYYQRLCANGHKNDVNCYTDDDEDVCRVCRASIVWRHLVDQTNGFRKEDHVVLEENIPAETCRCHCGFEHELKPATFKFPGGSQ